MDSKSKNQYLPDYVSPPGETIQEVLGVLGMTQADLAERTGRSQKTINEIIKGKAPITPTTAIQFERVFGISARFWNNRENNYREYLAKTNEQKRLESEVSWLDHFPLKELVERKWIQKVPDKADQLRELLKFFGIVNPKQWNSYWLRSQVVSYRQSKAFEADPYALATWIRQGEIEASQIKAESFEAQSFKEALGEIRTYTTESPKTFVPKMVELCSACGVAVVFIPELPKIRAYGVTCWLNPEKALIQLCLRYKTNDHLWFTFFHEAGHILLHGKRDVFIEEGQKRDQKENEADKFATDFLIPPAAWRAFLTQKYYPTPDIVAFSKEIGVHPGIVVGRLQHEKLIPYNRLNYLRTRLRWTSDN